MTEITREELHVRRIEMRGYRRSDGLYEVEGRVTDRKTQDFSPLVGDRRVPASEALHDMGVRIVFDDRMTVHDIATFTDAAPYRICPLGGLALQQLKGLRMTKGWGQEVRARLSGDRSCTHLMELLVPLATTAFQSLSALRQTWPDRLDAEGRPAKIGSCYAYGASRELVAQRWPAHHRPDADEGAETVS